MSRGIFLLLSALALSAAESPSVPRVLQQGTDRLGGINERIAVTVENLPADASKLVLFLDDRPLDGVYAALPPRGGKVLHFDLQRIAANKEAWNALLSRPRFESRPMALSIGPEKGAPFASEAQFNLKVMRRDWFWMWMAVFCALLALFIWAARSSNILREPGPEPENPAGQVPPPRKSYSLARTQMAFWFFLVVFAYVLIWMITWDRDTLTPTVLGLIGISAATGLGASVVDNSKRADASSKRDALTTELGKVQAAAGVLARAIQAAPQDALKLEHELAEREARVPELKDAIVKLDRQLGTAPSRHFLFDVLSDSGGISFHRFQIFVWTAVLGIIFGISVYNDLAMPEFSATLLGLMGISSGTYLGFKFPEQKG